MNTMKTVLLALILCCVGALTSVNGAVVYNDSGSVGAGSAVITDGGGSVTVYYTSADWSAFYQDGDGDAPPSASFYYTLHTSGGDYSVFAVAGGPPPPPGFPPAPIGWTFWSSCTDNLAFGHPDFLDAFWAVTPL